MKTAGIEILKAEVEDTFGRKILTSKDSIDLSDAIVMKNGPRINFNTLRRCFGLVKSNYPPSVSTLNILSGYCGFSSFDNLVKYKQAAGESVKKEMGTLLNYFLAVFQNVTVQNVDDPTFINLTRATIDFLNQNTEMAYEFQKTIVKTNNGKNFYFEYFVNIDKLNSYYGSGLRYYLAVNKDDDSQIFGHSILCLKYWLSMDFDNLEHNYKNLMQYAISEQVSITTSARYFSAKLFFAEASGLNTTEVICEAIEFYKNAKTSGRYNGSIVFFELHFAESLILTNHYSEALIFTSEGYRKNSLNYYSEDVQLFKSFKLYHTLVLANTGNEKRAMELFEQINPHEFYFIKKQFQSILYLGLGTKLNKIKSGKRQIDFLIKETGFIKMESLPIAAM